MLRSEYPDIFGLSDFYLKLLGDRHALLVTSGITKAIKAQDLDRLVSESKSIDFDLGRSLGKWIDLDTDIRIKVMADYLKYGIKKHMRISDSNLAVDESIRLDTLADDLRFRYGVNEGSFLDQ